MTDLEDEARKLEDLLGGKPVKVCSTLPIGRGDD